MEETVYSRAASNAVACGVKSLVTAGVLAICPKLGLPAVMISAILAGEAKHFASRLLSEKEDNRITRTLQSTKEKIVKRLESGEAPKWADMYNEQEPPLAPQELLEGTLLKVRDEYIQKKEDFYSSLFANYCFDNDISDSDANAILLHLHDLSYRQLLILSYLEKHEVLYSGKWESDFVKIDDLSRYYGVYADCERLFSNKLVGHPKGRKGIKLGFPDITLSPLGSKMVKLLELAQLDTNEIERDIKTIEAIINRHKG